MGDNRMYDSIQFRDWIGVWVRWSRITEPKKYSSNGSWDNKYTRASLHHTQTTHTCTHTHTDTDTIACATTYMHIPLSQIRLSAQIANVKLTPSLKHCKS